MRRVFDRLLKVLAGSTRDDLRRQVQFLKAENEVLRSRIKGPVRTTPQERSRLLKLGRPLGRALKELVTIVSPKTFGKWVAAAARGARPKAKARRGRPRTPEDVRRLVVRIARETDWGCVRILGELRKLGIRNISSTTVSSILKEHGIAPGPARRERTWDQFIKSHAETLWACDFASKKVWTPKGLVHAFVLVFIHVASRRVWASPSTNKPDGQWTAEQAKAFAAAAAEMQLPPGELIHDGDSKFAGHFGRSLDDLGIKAAPIPFHAPAMNAHVERFIGTLKGECLDRFIAIGTRHLDYLVGEFVGYYNQHRPHAGIGLRTPTGPAPPESSPPHPERIQSQERLGGLLRHYYSNAA